jgi:hypothetical protein
LIRLIAFYLFLLTLSSCQNQEVADSSGAIGSSAFSADNTLSKWSNSQFPLNLKYGSNFNPEEVSAIRSAANNWSDSVDNNLNFFNVSDSLLTGRSNSTDYDDGELGVYKIDTWPEDLPPSALAVTQIFGNKSSNGIIKIDHADILVNYDNFSFTTDDSWGYDFQSIILHEMGHFLGLFHSGDSSEDSIMYPSISRYTTNKFPKETDIENIAQLYDISSSDIDAQTFLGRRIASELSLETGPSEKVRIIIEIYPNGVERIKLIKGDKNEKTIHNCTHP